jgi:predicted ATPase/DNA-binding winged helix-turn-helix (wHTH) protein
MDRQDLRFGRFLARPLSRELFADGRPLRIGARAFELLLALAERPGEVLSRDELFTRVWPGRVVIDDNLKMQVMALRKLLGAEAVITVPRRGYRFGLAVEASAEAPARAALPRTEPLIGRDGELQALLEALATRRLLSLVGSAGIGKTRLALALAERSRPRFRDGAYVVDLGALDSEAAVVPTVQHALGLAPGGAPGTPASLAQALRSLNLLVVLDNCEHLVPAVQALARALLQGAPELVLLATSQVPLGLPDEQVWRVPPLGLAQSDDGGEGGALALFIARVRALLPSFTPDAASLQASAAVCRQLDGVPLALELAAARVPLLGVAGVLARLDRPLGLLTRGAAGAPTRQQTLRAAIAWSVGLLSPAERAVFQRLGCFLGSFAIEAALQVAGAGEDEIEWLDRLDSLQAKSLLQVVASGSQHRYRLLDSTRAYALEGLAGAGELAPVQRRHAEVTLGVFDAIDGANAATPLLELDARVQPELGNLRAAMAWALGPDGEPALAIGLSAAAGSALSVSGLFGEAALALDAARPWVDAERSPALQARYWLALADRGADANVPAQDTYAAALRALAIFRELGDVDRVYRILSLVVQHGHRVGAAIDVAAIAQEMRRLELPSWTVLQRRARRWIEARAHAQRGDWQGYGERMRIEVMLLQEAGDEWRAWVAAHGVALAEITLQRPQAAVEVMQPALAQIRARGLSRRCWQQVAIHAMACIATEDAALAAPAIREAVAVMRVAGSMSWMCTHLSWWVMQRSDSAAAARMHGWVGAHIAAHGETLGAHVVAVRERIRQHLVAQLPAKALEALLAEGARLSDDEAAAIALRAAG